MRKENLTGFGLRLPADLRDKIKVLADRDRRSMAGEIMYLAERGLEVVERRQAAAESGKTQVDLEALEARR